MAARMLLCWPDRFLPVVANVPVNEFVPGVRSLAIFDSTWFTQLHPGDRRLSQPICWRVVVTSLVRFSMHAALPVQLVSPRHPTSSVGTVQWVWKFVLMFGRATSSYSSGCFWSWYVCTWSRRRMTSLLCSLASRTTTKIQMTNGIRT